MAGQTFGFYIADLEDGRFIVCREQEPLFCFLRDTEEEAVRAAQETFVEYQRLFFQREARVLARPLDEVPVHRVTSGRAYAFEVSFV